MKLEIGRNDLVRLNKLSKQNAKFQIDSFSIFVIRGFGLAIPVNNKTVKFIDVLVMFLAIFVKGVISPYLIYEK